MSRGWIGKEGRIGVRNDSSERKNISQWVLEVGDRPEEACEGQIQEGLPISLGIGRWSWRGMQGSDPGRFAHLLRNLDFHLKACILCCNLFLQRCSPQQDTEFPERIGGFCFISVLIAGSGELAHISLPVFLLFLNKYLFDSKDSAVRWLILRINTVNMGGTRTCRGMGFSKTLIYSHFQRCCNNLKLDGQTWRF